MDWVIFKVRAQITDARGDRPKKRTHTYEFSTFNEAHERASSIKNGESIDGITLNGLWITREELVSVVKA